jgi:hypothetical protein
MAARLEVLKGGGDRLLSVRQAAEQLGLCTATVYGLCAEGVSRTSGSSTRSGSLRPISPRSSL